MPRKGMRFMKGDKGFGQPSMDLSELAAASSNMAWHNGYNKGIKEGICYGFLIGVIVALVAFFSFFPTKAEGANLDGVVIAAEKDSPSSGRTARGEDIDGLETVMVKPEKKSKWVYVHPAIHKGAFDLGYVAVERGWTLGGISKATKVSIDKLVEYNDIKNIDRIDVGQKIWLRPKVVLTEEEKLTVARHVLWERMTKSYYYRTRKKHYPTDADRHWALRPIMFIDESTTTPEIKRLTREVIHRMEWVDIVQIYGAICRLTGTFEDTLLLASMIEQESSYKNVPGKAGEIGPAQILPTTGYEVHKKQGMDMSFISVENMSDMLEDVEFNVETAWIHLKGFMKNGAGYHKALRRYNGHGPETKVYARLVTNRLIKFMKLWDKGMAELRREKLKELQ